MGAARKPVLPVAVVCAVLAGWLVWACVPALAAAPETPGAVTVGSPGAVKVLVRGVLNPHGVGAPGTYEFLYRASGSECEGGEHAPASPGLASGVEGEEVSQELVGLEPETEYTVCLIERNLNEGKGEEAVGPAVKFKTIGVLEAPTVTTPASEITDSSIKLQGVLNPGAPGVPGTYEFVYRRSASECQRENPETQVHETEYSTPTEVALGKEKEVVPVMPVEVGELEPNAPYTFCLLARNEAGETVVGAPVTFTTLSSKPSVVDESFSDVSATGVTINAQVNTGGLATTATVQYGTSSDYGSQTAGVALSAGADTATIELSGLEPDTEYHFRTFLANSDGNSTGIGNIFTTLPAGTNGLPDDRTYEMVTPPENDNSDVESPMVAELQTSEEGFGIPTKSLFQVASDGSKVTYSVLELDGANGGGGEGDQYLAERSPVGGWSQSSIQPDGYQFTAYQAFSNDLSIGIINAGDPGESEILPPLSPDALGEGYKILYERVTSGSGYRPLITNAVKLNRPPFKSFGSYAVDTGDNGATAGPPAFAGGSADFKDMLFEADDALLPGEGTLERELEGDVQEEIADKKLSNYLYDEADGHPSLVDISPEGKVVPDATFGALPFVNEAGSGERPFLESNPPDFSNVISSDGRFVYWTDLASGVVYVRVNGSSTVQVSGGPARYWTASADGHYALYTEGEGPTSELYRFDSEPKAGHPQREVLTAANAGVLGVLGASENASTVYFVAEGVLSSANRAGVAPASGEPNLYVVSGVGAPVFIATLSSADGNNVQPFQTFEENRFGDWQPGSGQRTARVTDDGGSVVFMSNQSLSVVGYPHGYPNNGSDEVYVYSAGSDQLFCASCGSTGEASSGGFLPIDWHATYLPQWISEDGNRVFFDSSAPLVAQDTNGRQDVYEWEREGHGSCTHGFGSTGACVFLLSGGSGEANSWFVGASANGNDAFIVTRAKLVPEDGNEAFDLYDVRVDGVKPVTPPVCTGSGCQGVPALPPLFATPPSVTFEGVGNFTPSTGESAKPGSKAKSLTRAKKLEKALKACEKQKKRKKRVVCEAHARKLYGPAQKSGKSSGGAQRRKHA